MNTVKIAGVEVEQDITVYCCNYDCIHHNNRTQRCAIKKCIITIGKGCSDFHQKRCINCENCPHNNESSIICESCDDDYSEWSPMQ